MNTRNILQLLANGCDDLADKMPANLTAALARMSADASDAQTAYMEGYCEGHIKAYRGLADDIRKLLRDNPSAGRGWPNVSFGFGFIWPFGSN